MAFEHLGAPYFRAGWGRNVVGMLLDDDTDWDEVAELLTESYCLQAPVHLVEQVDRPALSAGRSRWRAGGSRSRCSPAPGRRCSISSVGGAVELADPDVVAERVADAEVGAVGLLDRLLGDLDAGVAQRGVRRVHVVAVRKTPPSAPLVTRSRSWAAVSSSCCGPPGELEQELRVLLAGQADVSQRMKPRSASSRTSKPSWPQ